MDNDEAFLRTIADYQADDTARLIYADWLEECGDPRADFLRVQSALSQSPRDQSTYTELCKREQENSSVNSSEPGFSACAVIRLPRRAGTWRSSYRISFHMHGQRLGCIRTVPWDRCRRGPARSGGDSCGRPRSLGHVVSSAMWT